MNEKSENLLRSILVPVVGKKNAKRTARTIKQYDPDEIVVLHVVEKSGGGIDSASVSQREDVADEAFEAFKQELPDANVDTEIRYGSDIPDTVIEAAADFDTDSIVFTPRPSGRLVRLLTGDISHSLITDADRPVIALPEQVLADV